MALSPSEIALLVATVVGSGGAGAILGAIFKPSSKADLVKVAQEAAQSVIGDLRGEVDRLQGRVEALERENENCRAENNALKQQMQSLEDVLRKNGVQLPARDMPGSFIVLENDRTTVLKPSRKGKT
jgi:TolA-binding protein